jgi:hypothetical protein
MNNNIETKINMLYDFNYSKSFNNNMKSFNITIENISLDDIKVKNSTSQSHTDIITELSNGRFKLINQQTIANDSEINMIVLKRYTDGLSVSIFITPYKSYEEINMLSSANNSDCLFSYILSNMVLNKKIRHILLPVINIDVDFQQIIDIIKPYDTVYSEYMKAIELSTISNIFSLRVKENFFKCMTLKDYIGSNQYTIKKILFQIIITLAILQKEYKGFRHNLLNPDNIYVYLKKESTNVDRYEFEDMSFYIGSNSIDIKITNFFAASIPGLYSSSMELSKNSKKSNDYLDLHYFLNSLIVMIELPSDKNDELNVFLNKCIPKKYRSRKNQYIDETIELFKPSELLSDVYFEEYRNKSTNKSIDESAHMTSKMIKKSKNTVKFTELNESRILKKTDISNTDEKKSKSNKNKFISLDSDENNITGGGWNKFNKPPNQNIKNNPYISNENRRIKNLDRPREEMAKVKDDKKDDKNKDDKKKEETIVVVKPKQEEKKEPVVIASQEVLINPLYQKPFKPKEKASWDRNHVKFDNKYETMSKPDYKPPYEQKSEYKPPYETKPEFKKPYDSNKPYEKKPYDSNKPYEKKPYDSNKPYEKKPYDSNKPYEKKPYDSNKSDDNNKPDENKSYEKKSYDNNRPYEKKSYDSNRPYEKKSYDNKPDSKEFTETRRIRPDETDAKYKKPQYSDDEKKEYYRPQKYPNATEMPLLAEQKIYQSEFTSGPAKSTDHTHPKYSNPSFISLDNNIMYPQSFVADSAGYFPYMNPVKKVNEIPLQNVYNINLGNPSVHSNFLSRIYEDALPGDPFSFTMKSVFERNHLISFMRNSMVKTNDGEEMTMQVGQNSFLEYIRMLEFNPFALGTNPYTAIAPNFLIYAGSYPIKYNMETRMVEIAKHSMAVCIRMYMMTQGAINYRNLGPNITEDNFDVWREIKYYKWVKTELLDKKVCPNFITMILYKFDKISNVNYTQLYQIIGRYAGVAAIGRNFQLSQQINTALQPAYINRLAGQGVNLNAVGLHTDSNTSMVVLTESPTYNLIEWASPIYQTNGVIRTMTSSGYHSPDVWRSVLFQLAYAMAVLQQKEIYFRNFDIKYNVFIKDLTTSNTNIGYWIYKINNVDFYVPNYGYVVMIDSSNIQVEKPIPPAGALPAIPPATPFISVIPPVAPAGAPPAVIAAANIAIASAQAAIPILTTGAAPLLIPPAIGTVQHYNRPIFLYKILGSIYNDNGYDDPTYQPPLPLGISAPVLAPALVAAQQLAQANNLANLGIAAAAVGAPLAALQAAANAVNLRVAAPLPVAIGNPPIQLSWFRYLIREDFIRVMTPGDFSNNFNLQTNMEAPDPTILGLIGRMNAIPTANISDSLIQFFPEFLHNKIGDLLTKTERDLINPAIMPNFNNIRGKLIVYQERYDVYKWAIYVGPAANAGQKRIFFKDTSVLPNTYAERVVFNHSLCHFPEIENIEQIGNRPYKLTKDALIETYTFQ